MKPALIGRKLGCRRLLVRPNSNFQIRRQLVPAVRLVFRHVEPLPHAKHDRREIFDHIPIPHPQLAAMHFKHNAFGPATGLPGQLIHGRRLLEFAAVNRRVVKMLVGKRAAIDRLGDACPQDQHVDGPLRPETASCTSRSL